MAKGKKTGGRQKGSLNKTTSNIKAAIEDAFQYLEENSDGLRTWASRNQDVFYTQLMPKLLPVQLNHADNDGEKLEGFKVILVGKVS